MTEIEKKAKKKWEKVTVKNVNISKICMFSGGLDSCIGALNLLFDKEDASDMLFVSHYGGGKGTVEYQGMLKDAFINRFNVDENNFVQNYAALVTKKEDIKEDSTRSRSFMFFSHAIAYASAMGKEIELIIPENGLISLNIPLAYTRTGTSSTRTTHPHYMKMLQDLIVELGIHVKIKNPFQFKTKGEMILECKDREFLQEILDKTMSCSHPDVGRHQGMKTTMHCGYCLPCTIRRASIQKGGLHDTSIYFDSRYKKLPVARQAYRTYKCAFNNFDENNAFLRIQESGPIEENIEQFADLYDDRSEILRYVKQKASYTIAMTNLPQLFEKYKLQYVGNKYFQLALGFHPELVHQYSNQQVLFKELINETRFIGEIGLDYTKKSKEDVMCQTEIFERIIEWCSGKNKILSVHSRSASKKVIDILNGFDGTVILHWYSGGITDLRKAIEQGCYFSINHQMLQSVNGRNIVGNIPVDRILLESDAPFTKGLSEKYTIDFNDVIYKYIGELYHQELDVVKKRIKANFAEVLKK